MCPWIIKMRIDNIVEGSRIVEEYANDQLLCAFLHYFYRYSDFRVSV